MAAGNAAVLSSFVPSLTTAARVLCSVMLLALDCMRLVTYDRLVVSFAAGNVISLSLCVGPLFQLFLKNVCIPYSFIKNFNTNRILLALSPVAVGYLHFSIYVVS